MEKRPIVIDTGPLLTYLALRYLDGSGASKAKRDEILRDIRPRSGFAETEQERFLQVMKQPALTTAHVISEALKLRDASALGREKETFRRNSLAVLTGDTISEIRCPIVEICLEEDFRELICRHGLTDASLIFIASRNRALLLTDDGRLFRGYSVRPGYYTIKLLDDFLRQAD